MATVSLTLAYGNGFPYTGLWQWLPLHWLVAVASLTLACGNGFSYTGLWQ